MLQSTTMYPTTAPHVRALLIAGLLLCASMSHAQQVCGTMERLQQETMANPQRAARQQALETFTRQWLAENGTAGARSIITIPVVFHVLWRTAEENVSDARLQAQLQQLNADFARQNTDAVQTPATFAGVAADTDIRFCLAQRDPDGHPTTGIIRRQTTFNELYYGNNDVFHTATGGSDAWPRASYLNIWVCDLGSGLFGYAQFPGGAAATDGIVLQNAVVGGFASPGTLDGYQYGRTATHEVGHWLSLIHIWGDVACGNDLVDDTPVHFDANYGCPTHPHLSTCPGTSAEMFMNYMDYATDGCKNMFTAGQAARMQAVLASSISQRDQLAGSLGCLPPDGGSACAAPQGLVASAVDETTATVEWDAVSGATGYDVRYRPFGTGTWTTWNTTGTTLDLTDLVDATTYDWQVRANCTSGPSTFSDIVLFTTGNDDADGDGYPAGIDCDDTDPSIHPGAPELCDGVDNDCDGQVDEGLVVGIIVIESEDGVSEGSAHVQVMVGGTTLYNGNVDIVLDPDQGITLGQVNVCAPRGCLEVLVQETGLALYPEGYLQLLGGTETFIPFVFTSGTPVLVPTGALVEICGNGIDDDCDGEVDEGILWYTDADGDGYGDPSTGQLSCMPIPGMVPTGGDCDDQDAAVSPGAWELCDGIDNDCDGLVDEGCYIDADGDGYMGWEDCDDTNNAVFPGAQELCDGIDNDCDGQVDEGLVTFIIGLGPADGVSEGNAHLEVSTGGTLLFNGNVDIVHNPVFGFVMGEVTLCAPPGCLTVLVQETGLALYPEGYLEPLDGSGSFIPFAFTSGTPVSVSTSAMQEICGNGIDDDCDGLVDEETLWYTDADGDGYGDPATGQLSCTPIPGMVPTGGDCDDQDPARSPGMEELCDGIDNNCNGQVDEGFFWCADADGDGYGDPATAQPGCPPEGSVANGDDCDDANAGLTAIGQPCDDDDPDTHLDTVNGDCLCSGIPVGTCPPGEIPDCNGNCAPADWVGDMFCDDGTYDWHGIPIHFNCAEFGNDGGDCTDADGDGYTTGGIPWDCDDNNPAITAIGHLCDDGDPNTHSDIAHDGCICVGTPFGTCPEGQILDCNGNCSPVALLGNGTCEANFNCSLFGYDGFDCWDTCPAEICGNGIDDDCDGLVDEDCGLQVSVRAFLEGPYDPATGLMNDGMRALGLVPTTEPYSLLGYPHVGGGGESTTAPVLAASGSNAIVDWMVLELRDAGTPAHIVVSRSALVQRDGDVVDTDGASPVLFDAPPGDYHVALRHRNHLGIMTADPMTLVNGLTLLDLTSELVVTHGTDARKAITGTNPALVLWQGDVDGDERIQYTGDGNDRDLILQAIGGTIPTSTVTGYRTEDVNMDGVVKYTGDGNDRDPILQNIGGTVPTNVKEGTVP